MYTQIVASLIAGLIPMTMTPAYDLSWNTNQPAYFADRFETSNPVEGRWEITEGKDLDGNKYTGTVEITARDQADQLYSLEWNTSEGEFSGLGFLQDDHLFFGWAPKGEIYGVILYRIQSDGTLEGKWTYSNTADQVIGQETATKEGDDDLEGRYRVAGEDIEGEYEGTLEIRRSGDTYQFDWSVDNQTLRGVGLRSDDWLIVGWGPQDKIGVLDYKIKEDKATGRWTILGQSELGVDKIRHERAR
jgi:hypothetical protein